MNEKIVRVCAASEISLNQLACFDVHGHSILIANINGRFHAVSAMCTHEEYPLCHGGVKHGYVECSLHGSRFNLETGAPLEQPATKSLRVYPLKIEHGDVFITI